MTNIDQAEPKRSASFTIEERRSLLAEFKTSELHYADFAKQKNISKRTFACWLRYESLSPEKKASFRYHGPYSPTERKKTIEAYVSSGMILEEFAAAWGMSPSTLSGWMQRYQAGGLQALERYRPAKAGDKRRGSRLPVAVRQEIIAIKRKEPWFGLRKIRDWLLRFRGVRVSANTINKTIKEEGLPLLVQKKKRHKSSDRIRRFERARPMQLWQSDITSFLLKRHSTRVYLTVFMDDHSRFIVSFRLQTRQTADLVIDAFKDGCSRYGKPEEVLTDQGRQYFAWRGKSEFEEILRKEGIKHVVSRAHHPETLGKCERFWKTVESEFWDRIYPEDLDEARVRLKHFIDHYNYQRPHQGLSGASPADRFFGVESDIRKVLEKTINENSIRLATGDLPKPPAFLIGQIGEKRISFHGTSGQFFLTHENIIGESNDERGNDCIDGVLPGGADSAGSGSENSDEASKSLNRKNENAVSSNSSQRNLGSSEGRREIDSGRQGYHHTSILDGAANRSSGARADECKSASFLADDTTSGSWFNSRTPHATEN